MNKSTDEARRNFLLNAGALTALSFGSPRGALAAEDVAQAAATAKPLPAYVSWKDAGSMIVHSASTLETRRTAFGTSIITPAEQLYIRNNLPAPDASLVQNRDGWELAVTGVSQPRTLTVSELKKLGLDTVAMVLQCSGNGRGLFPSKPSGTPWIVGAAGCVMWSGIPVRTIAEALGGVAQGMRFMTSTGGEIIPAGIDPKSVMVERSVPLAAMRDAMLAWEMNGAPIPLAHGGPLRMIVPGYTGVNSVKYIKQLAFTAAESEAAIQRTGYRMSPPGEKGDPNQRSVWEMSAKSWINSPAPEAGPVQRGLVQVKGVAFGGMNGVRRVDISMDGGKSWKEARLVGPNLGRYAWRQFVLPMHFESGSYTVASRIVDERGNMQADQRIENAGGYVNTSWRDHAVELKIV